MLFLLRTLFAGGEKMARKGSKYECEKCGIVVTVDKNCNCVACDLMCCGAPMKEVKPKAKAKAKAKKK
jgi:hypothetical protein